MTDARRFPSLRCRQPGASRFELLVCVALIGVFMAVFLERALYYQEYAEKMAMDMTVENMRTGLRYRVADLMLANRMSQISTLADENPMDWLADKPDNYFGERASATAPHSDGMWYFDRQKRELVYTVNNRRHFLPSVNRDFTVRFRAMRLKTPVALGGSGATGEVWVRLALVSDYRWLQ